MSMCVIMLLSPAAFKTLHTILVMCVNVSLYWFCVPTWSLHTGGIRLEEKSQAKVSTLMPAPWRPPEGSRLYEEEPPGIRNPQSPALKAEGFPTPIPDRDTMAQPRKFVYEKTGGKGGLGRLKEVGY